MTNDTQLKDDSFTLVTSQRKNKKKFTNKQRAKQTFNPPEEDFVDEDAVIKYVQFISYVSITKLY